MKARASPQKALKHSASHLKPCARKLKRSLVRGNKRHRVIFLLLLAQRKFWSCHFARRYNLAITTLGPNISFSDLSAKAKELLLRFLLSWAQISIAFATK